MVINKLKEIRMREYMMSPKEFAFMLGINQKTYYNLETGESKPTLEKALEISKKLNKTVNEIWYLDER